MSSFCLLIYFFYYCIVKVIDLFQSSDLDECNTNQDACGSKASCINTVGSYTCLCDSSYQGGSFECCKYDTYINEKA